MSTLFSFSSISFLEGSCGFEAEQEWRALFDAAVTSIIGGRCANSYFGDFSINSIVDEAIRGADRLLKELKEREETEN